MLIRAQSGAIIFGKTTTTEFATSKHGDWHQNRTANVYDSKRTPGGSSSGSGAAVGDGQVPIALGTQTGGSIVSRNYVSWCSKKPLLLKPNHASTNLSISLRFGQPPSMGEHNRR